MLECFYTAWVNIGSCEFKGSSLGRRGAAYVGDFPSHFNAEHSPAVRSAAAAAAAAAHAQAGKTRKGGGGKREGAKTYRVSSRDAVSQHAVIDHGVRQTHTQQFSTQVPRARCACRCNGFHGARCGFVLKAWMRFALLRSHSCVSNMNTNTQAVTGTMIMQQHKKTKHKTKSFLLLN